MSMHVFQSQKVGVQGGNLIFTSSASQKFQGHLCDGSPSLKVVLGISEQKYV